MTVKLPKVGDTFLERYELVRVVGYGGYGRIYEATQLDIGRRVALKVIAPPDEDEMHLSSETFAERFEREARAISRLKDPHTVTMYDHGEHEGLLYMVLEFIDGKTISDLIATVGALPAERVDGILRQVLLSLMEAHSQGLVHRDIKPSNIMVYEHMGDPDRVKLLDFGLVKSITGEQVVDAENLTKADVLVGTPRYMSPEQVRQETIAPATDVYSVGLVAYEMLTGEPLLTENQAMAIIARHIDKAEFNLDKMPGTPALRAAIVQMLKKNPADRFATAGAALDALDAEVTPPAWRKALPVLAFLVPLLVAGVVRSVAFPVEPADPPPIEPAAVEAKQQVAEVEQPELDDPPPTEPAGPAEPVFDQEQQRRVVSAMGWSTARVGFALESAEGAVDEADKRRARRIRRNHRAKQESDNGRNLRIFEP